MTRSRRLYFLLGLAVLLLCAAAAAPRARALWAQLPSGEWIEAADCAARREAPAPGRDALHVRAGMRPARLYGHRRRRAAPSACRRRLGGRGILPGRRAAGRQTAGHARRGVPPARGVPRMARQRADGRACARIRRLTGRAGLCSRPLPMMPKGVSSAAMLPGKRPFLFFFCAEGRVTRFPAPHGIPAALPHARAEA